MNVDALGTSQSIRVKNGPAFLHMYDCIMCKYCIEVNEFWASQDIALTIIRSLQDED